MVAHKINNKLKSETKTKSIREWMGREGKCKLQVQKTGVRVNRKGIGAWKLEGDKRGCRGRGGRGVLILPLSPLAPSLSTSYPSFDPTLFFSNIHLSI